MAAETEGGQAVQDLIAEEEPKNKDNDSPTDAGDADEMIGVKEGRDVPSESRVLECTDVPSESGVQEGTDVPSEFGVQGGTDVSSESGVKEGTDVPSESGVQESTDIPSESGVQEGTDVPSESGIQEDTNVPSESGDATTPVVLTKEDLAVPRQEDEIGRTGGEKENGHDGGDEKRDEDTNEERDDSKEDGEKKDDDDWVDILGTGHLKKKVLQEGQGMDTRPERGQMVTIRSKGQLPSGDEIDCYEELQFVLGDGDVLQGKAKKKENPVLWAQPTAFSPFAQFFFTPKNGKISHFLEKS